MSVSQFSYCLSTVAYLASPCSHPLAHVPQLHSSVYLLCRCVETAGIEKRETPWEVSNCSVVCGDTHIHTHTHTVSLDARVCGLQGEMFTSEQNRNVTCGFTAKKESVHPSLHHFTVCFFFSSLLQCSRLLLLRSYSPTTTTTE